MPTAASNTFSIQGLEPFYDPANALVQHVKLPNSVTLSKGQVLGEKVGTNSIQRVTISGGPTGGTFTLTFSSQTTAGIAFGASLAVVKAAFEALSSVGRGNAKVTGSWNGTGAVIDIEFVGTLGAAAQSAITCSVAGLTGGTPAQAITQVQTGAAGTPGTFAAYSAGATDGSQVARAVLQYDCTVDGSGNITVGGGEHGETSKSAPAFFSGTFNAADLVGMTLDALADLGGKIVSGTIAAGVVRIG